MKLSHLFFIVLAFFLTCVSHAEAHAFLNAADPKVGSTVVASPPTIRLWFTRHLKQGASTFEVLDAKDTEVDKGDVKIDADDRTLMTVSVPKLKAGTYKVIWTAVCIDGHTTHGNFTFEVSGS